MLNINITEDALLQKEKILDENGFGVIYGHKCTETNKWYIGQTSQKNPLSRWGLNGRRYLEKENGEFRHKKFAPAILKYGWDKFEHYILGYYLIEDLKNFEIFWISEKNSFLEGYNSTDGSEPVNRKKERNFKKLNKEERILKYSHPHTEETKQYLREINLGKHHTEETKRKMSESHKGKIPKITPERNKKLSDIGKTKIGSLNSFYGKHHTEETKQKLRESSSKPVLQIDPITNEIIKRFPSPTVAAKEVGLSNCSTISHCCLGSQQTSKGFKWRYE